MEGAWNKTIEILREQPEHRMALPRLIREMGNRGAMIFGLDREDIVYEMRHDGVVRIDERQREVYLIENSVGRLKPAYRG
jgi:hypothetical protein